MPCKLHSGEETQNLLTNKPGAPDLYIVTPFVVVADRLRKLVEESALLVWTDDPRRWTFERIGTVHTVQGREAGRALQRARRASAPFVTTFPAAREMGSRQPVENQ